MSCLIGSVCREGEFHVLGPLGNKLLRVVVSEALRGHSLELWLDRPKATNIAKVVPCIPSARKPKKDLQELQRFEICAQGGHYGMLVPRGDSFFVTRPGQALAMLVIRRSAGTGIQLSVSSGEDGRLLASAACGQSSLGGMEHLELRIKDTALVLLCVLAIVLLYSGQAYFTSGAVGFPAQNLVNAVIRQQGTSKNPELVDWGGI